MNNYMSVPKCPGELQSMDNLLVCSGCRLNSLASSATAKGGHLSVLQWKRANGCRTCQFAAEGGHLSVLQWARENGCDWDSQTCEAAAESGHLSVLQCARENRCPWGWGEDDGVSDVYDAARRCSNPDVSNYLIHHAGLWPEDSE